MAETAPGPSLQERYAPHNACFGCGPANAEGLRIRSFPADGAGPEGPVVAEWAPLQRHEAFPGVLNGGIIGTLLDCHGNWTAAWHLMRRDGQQTPPCTVTADFLVRMKRPTPSDGPVRLSARVVASEGKRVTVEAELSAAGEVTATCTGHFVAVGPGHPAYQRW
ncbi:MAG TPA: PaaI family thioesterase [Thermoanaerobaculia bacterium]|nr:PaaI family thioesterase [Thermoanaerobaculia bacterium]